MIRRNFSNLFAIALCLSASLYCASNTSAAPNITGVSGAVVNDAKITVSGSSYGSGPIVIKWDNFEGATHTVGQMIGVGPGSLPWSVYHPSETEYYTNPKISDSNPRNNSAKYVRSSMYLLVSGQDKSTSIFEMINNNPMPKVFISMYLRWDQLSGLNQSNEKFWRIAGNGWATTVDPYIRYVTNSNDTRQVDIVSGSKTWSLSPYDKSPNENEWIRMDMYAVQGDPNTPNGTCIFVTQYSENGSFRTVINKTDAITRDESTDNWYAIIFENYLSLPDYQGATAYNHDYDDIYIADSRARVELGNSPNWANCTHREIQIPNSWSDTSIQFTVNQGSYRSGECAYIYVVDKNNINSNGYPILIGGGDASLCSNVSDTEGPIAPTGLRIAK
jgi:hypothetical protein